MTDPNADLIGFSFAGITVVGSASWSPTYLYVETARGPSVRATSLVRSFKLKCEDG